MKPVLPVPRAPRWGRASWHAAAAPIAAISVFGLAISMSHPLLALVLEYMGASGVAIGANTTAGALAMVLSAPILPRIMARTGLAPLLIVSCFCLAAIFLLYGLFRDYWAWMGLRMIYGFFATAMFFGSEYWIVTAAPEGQRGRVVAAYTIAMSLAFAAGPLIVGWTGVEGMLPFLIGAGILLTGLVPLLLGLSRTPAASPEDPPSPRTTLRFFVTDPAVVWAVVLFGVVEYGTVALLPVWGVRAGLTEDSAVYAMASFAAGALLLAMPIGWAADRFDRRWLLLVLALATVGAPLAMMGAAPDLVPVIGFGLLWGAAAVGLYTVPLVELGARYRGHRLAEGNAALVLGYGLGALISPAILGLAMDLAPPHGLLYAAAGASLAYAGLALARIRAARRRAA